LKFLPKGDPMHSKAIDAKRGEGMRPLAAEIEERLSDFIEKRRQVTPCHTNRASELGEECLRYLYYCRTEWDKRQPPSRRLEAIYLEGMEQELAVIRLLLGLGFRIEEQGKSLSIPDYQITGTIDGFIANGEMRAGIEIKSLERYIFESVNSVEDFKNPKRPWLRRYLAQATLYMAMTHQSSWLFILKNRSRLELKLLEYDFDLDFYNILIEKAKMINEAVARREPPPALPYLPGICEPCPFNHICEAGNGEVKDDNFEKIDAPDIREMIKEYFMLKEAHEKFEIVKEDIRAQFSGRNAIIGEDYKIKSRLVEVKPDPSPKPRKGYKYWAINISDIRKE